MGVHGMVVARVIDAGGSGDGRVIQVVAAVVVVMSSTPAVGHSWGGDRVVGVGAGHRRRPGGGSGGGGSGSGSGGRWATGWLLLSMR